MKKLLQQIKRLRSSQTQALERDFMAKFRAWRIKEKMTLRDAAKELAISPQYLCDMEYGRRHMSDAMIDHFIKLLS